LLRSFAPVDASSELSCMVVPKIRICDPETLHNSG
jgi:hypothetical protein